MRRTLAVATTLVGATLLSGQAGPDGALSRRCQDFTIEARAQVSACTTLLRNSIMLEYIGWQLLMARATANLRANDVENAKQDYARALQHITTIQRSAFAGTWYASLCWTYAVLNLELQHALVECNEGLRLTPTSGPAFNSRGFVFLRLGRFAEAVADYDRALERPLTEYLPDLVDSRIHQALFGRGIAKLRLGDTAGGNADIAAAEKMRPGATTEFSLYGIKP